MVNHNLAKETALSIYQAGYHAKKEEAMLPDSKEFFIALRKAIITELETTGFCELIYELVYALDKNKEKLDAIVYSVFADIYTNYETQSLVDIEANSEYRTHVPYFKDISWNDCEYFGCKVAQSYDAYNYKFLHTIFFAERAVRISYIKAMRESKVPTPEATPTIQAPEVPTSSQAEADKLLETAKTEAQRIIQEAKENAKVEAQRITDSAQLFVDNARRAEEERHSLLNKYLITEQKHYKNELNEQMTQLTAEYLKSFRSIDATHKEMCDVTNAIQAKWIQTLDNAVSQIISVKAEFYSTLHDWQVSLFKTQMKPIAEKYLELYKILNVDKLLREAILFEYQRTTDITKSQAVEEPAGPSVENNLAPSSVIEGLQKLNKTLSTFLRRFEIALSSLDLYVYYPKPGDVFDDTWHIPDEEDEEYYGKPIKECLVPGIARRSNDNGGDDVLIPAVVRVETED